MGILSRTVGFAISILGLSGNYQVGGLNSAVGSAPNSGAAPETEWEDGNSSRVSRIWLSALPNTFSTN